MDPTVEFFAKLKTLAVTLETETDRLQQRFESRKSEDDTDTAATAMRAYHGVNCDISNLKGQIQEELVEQKANVGEVSTFIKECEVMKERISQDIHALKERWEKYGYQAPKGAQKAASTNGHESAADDENEAKVAGEGEGSDEAEDAGGAEPTSPLLNGPPPDTDPLRTPQPSDFGLSELFLKKGLARSEWCPEEPPMPQISLPQPFNEDGPPPMPVTPKCALWLDDNEPKTPNLSEFAILEPTQLNDFTMDLLKKNVLKPQRRVEDIPAPVNPLMDHLQSEDNLASPEMPEFCTSGFSIKKAKLSHDPSAQTNGKPDFPERRREIATTPEMPELKTAFLRDLIGAKKVEPTHAQANGDDGHLSDLLTPPRKGPVDSKLMWDYNVPQMSFPGGEEQQMNSLQSKSMTRTGGDREGLGLELHGRAQIWGKPHMEEPRTPEMPDLSSITGDICKLLSQAQLKKVAMALEQPNVRADKIVPQKTVCLVSDSEFQSLPRYLKVVTLDNLNQAIHNINAFVAHDSGEKAELQIEELQRIISAGPKTRVSILCLTELRRLTHVGGVKDASVYTLNTHD